MVDLSNYSFKVLIQQMVKPEEYFINTYVKKYIESNSTICLTHRMRIILDTKYEKGWPKQGFDQTMQTFIY